MNKTENLLVGIHLIAPRKKEKKKKGGNQCAAASYSTAEQRDEEERKSDAGHGISPSSGSKPLYTVGSSFAKILFAAFLRGVH